MRNETVIHGNQIENLITRFYYKNQQLCFQIILNLGLNQKVPFSEYNDYHTYKQTFNRLLKAKEENTDILLPAIQNAA